MNADTKKTSPTSRVGRESAPGGLPLLTVELVADLKTAEAQAVHDAVLAQADGLEGREFFYLLDTRKVTRADAEALGALQKLETALAERGLLRVAHLVKDAALVEKAQAEYQALGHTDLIGNFLQREDAMQFLASGGSQA